MWGYRIISLARNDMGIFDELLGNLGNIDDIAGKLGISTEQLQDLVQKFGEGDLGSAMQAAQEHGLSMDKVQALVGGGSFDELLGKASGMLGEGGEGISGLMKGLLGKN
jgi:hypothetical protein